MNEGERHELRAGGLALEFLWTGDRWSHALSFTSSSAEGRPIVRSLEGSPERDDEPGRISGPSYQQLHLPDASRAFAVGQSGPHHFSAVFDLSGGPGPAVLGVDLADRCRDELLGLGATYLVDLPSGDLVEAAPDRISWAPADLPGGRLDFEAIAPARVAFAEAGRRATRVQVDGPIRSDVTTHRLAYRWRWTA